MTHRIGRLPALLLTGSLLLTIGFAAPEAHAAPEDNWVLTWSDEFDGTGVDESKWGFDTGNWILDAKGNPVTNGWGNNEKEYYKRENATVADGILSLTAKQEAVHDPVQGDFDYTSAKLLTKGKFSTCYGRIEVRARMDTGASLWPAIWMLPEEQVYGAWATSGELDIMEGWGSRPSDLCGTIHFGDVWPNNTYLTKEYTLPDSTVSDWHTYAIEWEAGEIRWYADDVLYSTQTNWYAVNRTFPAPFDQNFYLILNLAVGGHFDGVGDGTQADPTLFANGAQKQMQVDYVRVYQKDGKQTIPVKPSQPAMTLYAMAGGNATLQNYDDRSVAEVLASGSQTYSVMLAKECIPLTAGVPYTISFSVAASTKRPVLVTLEDAAYNRLLSETIQADTTPMQYTFAVTPEQTDSLDFKLQLGNLGEGTPTAAHTVTLSGLSITPAGQTGDCNGDGSVNAADAAVLRDFLCCKGELPQAAHADCNADGRINALDLTLLKRLLLQ